MIKLTKNSRVSTIIFKVTAGTGKKARNETSAALAPIFPRKRNVKRNSPVVRYLLDTSNDEYFIREMERRRTEPY